MVTLQKNIKIRLGENILITYLGNVTNGHRSSRKISIEAPGEDSKEFVKILIDKSGIEKRGEDFGNR